MKKRKHEEVMKGEMKEMGKLPDFSGHAKAPDVFDKNMIEVRGYKRTKGEATQGHPAKARQPVAMHYIED